MRGRPALLHLACLASWAGRSLWPGFIKGKFADLYGLIALSVLLLITQIQVRKEGETNQSNNAKGNNISMMCLGYQAPRLIAKGKTEWALWLVLILRVNLKPFRYIASSGLCSEEAMQAKRPSLSYLQSVHNESCMYVCVCMRLFGSSSLAAFFAMELDTSEEEARKVK